MRLKFLRSILLLGFTWSIQAGVQDASRWEEAIRSFESDDKKGSPGEVELLFLGSSSIRGWDLARYFPGRKTLNRGFGGSQISDSLFFAERIVVPHTPEVIVFYAGDNDIAAGKSPLTVYSDYQSFVSRIRRHLPSTRIVFVSIKPSLNRWHLVDKMREANKRIEEFSQVEPGLDFLDVDELMIGADGKPRRDLFVADGLHLSPEGYRLWSDALISLLDSVEESGSGGSE